MIDVDEVYKVPLNSLNQFTQETKSVEVDTNAVEPKKDLKNAAANLHTNSDASESNFTKNLNLYKSGRFNLFERHVNQIFIRGDNVVTVVLAD